MTSNTDNVYPFPDTAARAYRGALKHQSGVAQVKGGVAEAIEGAIECGQALLDLRKDGGTLRSNASFKQLVGDSKIHTIKPFDSQQERNAAMQMAEVVHGSSPVDAFAGCPNTRPSDIMKWYRDKHPELAQAKNGKARSRPVEDKAREAVRDRVHAGTPVKAREVAKEAGVSHVMVEQAAAMERARLEVFAELRVDPATLSLSAQAKLAVATRQMEKRLNAEHAKRVAGLNEEVRLRLLADTKERLAWMHEAQEEAKSTVKLYQKWIGDATPIFTEAQFFTILKALDPAIEHRLTAPDPELVKRFNDATVLLNAQRERLTLKKRK